MNFLKYIESTILGQVKEKIVCAWIVQVRHFGSITTNIVKYDHDTLRIGWEIVKVIYVEFDTQ